MKSESMTELFSLDLTDKFPKVKKDILCKYLLWEEKNITISTTIITSDIQVFLFSLFRSFIHFRIFFELSRKSTELTHFRSLLLNALKKSENKFKKISFVKRLFIKSINQSWAHYAHHADQCTDKTDEND